MKELKGTQTEKNLLEAMAGESMARNKYNWFASQAKKDGFEEIAAIFDETAGNEKEHAKLWFKYLNGIGDTKENLAAAAAGENYEHSNMYKNFAEAARAEGFDEIATRFEGVGAIEKLHEERYLELLKQLKNETVFKKSTPTTWVCRNCGHHFIGASAPYVCPVCVHPTAHFEVLKTPVTEV